MISGLIKNFNIMNDIYLLHICLLKSFFPRMRKAIVWLCYRINWSLNLVNYWKNYLQTDFSLGWVNNPALDTTFSGRQSNTIQTESGETP